MRKYADPTKIPKMRANNHLKNKMMIRSNKNLNKILKIRVYANPMILMKMKAKTH